jgi:hypothetical protein
MWLAGHEAVARGARVQVHLSRALCIFLSGYQTRPRDPCRPPCRAHGSETIKAEATPPGFFLPVRVLSRLFRRLFLEKLAEAHRSGKLQCLGEHQGLADPNAFTDWLQPLRECEWVVYAQRPFGGPEAVLTYLFSLYPPRGHLQPAAHRPRWARRHLHPEELPH